MTNHVISALVLAAFSVPGATLAAAEARPESDLIADCAGEARGRFLDGVAADHVTIAVGEVTRSEVEDVVRIAVTSGEGRSVRATSKFRGGALLDVRR